MENTVAFLQKIKNMTHFFLKIISFLAVLGLPYYARAFLQLRGVGATLELRCMASHCDVLLCFPGFRAQAQQLWHVGCVVLQYVGSSWIRHRTGDPCPAGWILNHWTTREAPTIHFWVYSHKNGKQDLEEIFAHPLSQQHYSP